jgi:Tol biopolymer transport system component
MNPGHNHDLEREVAAWLRSAAPAPDQDLADRALRRTVATAQRGRGPAFGRLVRFAGLAAVIAVAIAIGLQLEQLIQPPSGASPVPVVSAVPTASPSPTLPSPIPSAWPSQASVPAVGRIAFSANRDNASSDIYLMDADGRNIEQLTTDSATHELDPLWSPDGTRIAYTTLTTDGSAAGGVFVIEVATGRITQVSDQYAYTAAVWSPDGSMLALGGNGGAPTGISLFSLSDAKLRQVTTDGGTAQFWSPDGSRIAYNASNDVWILDVATGESRNLTGDPSNDSIARWSDGGARVVFVSDRGTDQSKGSQRSWVVDVGGGQPELLGTPVDAYAHWPSPDGQWLVYGADDGLHLSRTDGSEDRLVQDRLPADSGPSWASDSSAFVFSNTVDGARDIFVMHVDASARLQITNDSADESAPAWQPATVRP